MLTPKW